eukprot:gene10910-461_t
MAQELFNDRECMQEDEPAASDTFLVGLLHQPHWAQNNLRRLRTAARDADMWLAKEVANDHEFTKAEMGDYLAKYWGRMNMTEKWWNETIARFLQLDSGSVLAPRLKRNLMRLGLPNEGQKCDHAWRLAMHGVLPEMLQDEEPSIIMSPGDITKTPDKNLQTPPESDPGPPGP